MPHDAGLVKVIAYLVLLLAVFEAPGLSLFPLGAVLAIGLLVTSFFTPSLRRSRHARVLLGATVFSAVAGIVLRFLGVHPDSEVSNTAQALEILGWLLATPAVVLAALWAFERVDTRRGLVAVLLGASASALLNAPAFAWKGSTGIYLTGLALALTWKRPFWSRIVLLGATYLNATNDARTMALITICVFIATFLGDRQVASIGRHPRRSLLILAASFALLTFAMVQAMLSGLLGRAVQVRTIVQTSGGRDLITSGRAEWAATLDLMANSPFGFGLGVVPPSSMQRDALGAVRQSGGDYVADYWATNVFIPRLDLHSITANMWSHFSIGGVLLAGVTGWILIAAFPLAVAAVRKLGPLPLFALLTASWDLLFSPLADSDRLIVGLIAAVVLLTTHDPGTEKSPALTTRTGLQSRLQPRAIQLKL